MLVQAILFVAQKGSLSVHLATRATGPTLAILITTFLITVKTQVTLDRSQRYY